MKKNFVLVSQRVSVDSQTGERRDGLDQKWSTLLQQLNLIPIAVPNNKKLVELMVDSFERPDLIILTGGNSLTIYGGDAPERDETEDFLINYSRKSNIPLLGVCRGMQSLLNHYGAVLEKVDNHVRTFHELDFQGQKIKVNSYHNWAIKKENLNQLILPLAISQDDNTVEAIKIVGSFQWGIMWHPEREERLSASDRELFELIRNSYCKG